MKIIKQALRSLLMNTPLVSDICQEYWLFPRTPNSFRGVFKTFSEAEQTIPSHFRLGYNLPELHKFWQFSGSEVNSSKKSPAALVTETIYIPSAQQTIKLGAHPLFKFHQSDYPLLVWLNDALKNSLTVFDFGGSLGFSYYTHGMYLSYPVGLKWTVCDVPEAVAAGQELVKDLDLPDLSFTDKFAEADGTDLLIACGSLQYVEPSLADLLKTLKVKPRYLLINQSPFYDSEQYVTIQNLIHSCIPYKIQNRSDFVNDILSLAYELIDSWHDNRTCSIPFHPESDVSGYHGFYFRAKEVV